MVYVNVSRRGTSLCTASVVGGGNSSARRVRTVRATRAHSARDMCVQCARRVRTVRATCAYSARDMCVQCARCVRTVRATCAYSVGMCVTCS